MAGPILDESVTGKDLKERDILTNEQRRDLRHRS